MAMYNNEAGISGSFDRAAEDETPSAAVYPEKTGLAAHFLTRGENMDFLTLKEERALFRTLRSENQPAHLREASRRRLLTAHVRLVEKIAKRFCKPYLTSSEMEEAIAAGLMGVNYSIDRYDESKGARLCTLALLPIRQEVTRYLLENGEAFRLIGRGFVPGLVNVAGRPVRGYMLRPMVYKVQNENPALSGEQALSKICDDQKVSGKQREKIFDIWETLTQPLVRLDSPVASGSDATLHNYVADTYMTAPDQGLPGADEAEEKHEILAQALADIRATTPARNMDIFLARRLNDADEKVTLEDLAAKHGITRERVRQIQETVEARIKKRALDISVEKGLVTQAFADAQMTAPRASKRKRAVAARAAPAMRRGRPAARGT